MQSGEGASYFVQRLRVRIPPVVQTAVAQMAEQSTQADGSLCKDSGVVKVRVTSVERPGDESGRVRVRCSLALRKKSRSKDRPLQLRGNSSKKYRRGPMVPTGREKSTAASKLGVSRSGCATETPGWRGGELLRLLNDVERTRSSQSAQRRKKTGEAENLRRGWTWCRTGLLR